MSLFLSPALNFNFFGKKNEEKANNFFVACYVISVDYQNFINTSTNLVAVNHWPYINGYLGKIRRRTNRFMALSGGPTT